MCDSILVFDFGTSYFKAALVDANGALRCVARVPTPTDIDGDRREIDPATFTRVVRELTHRLATQMPNGLEGVRAVTFCTQANTFVLLDDADRPLTPLIVWNDERAQGIAPELAGWTQLYDYRRLTGIPQLNHYFAIAKLRWIATHQPHIYRAARRLCFLGDYFTHWLTGLHVTDGSVAGLSGLFAVEDWHWSEQWAGLVDVKIEWLPEVLRSGTTIGSLVPSVAAELGLPGDCLFAVGILDQYAGAIGVGNRTPGGISETTGTVLATVRCAGTFEPTENPRAFRGPAAEPGKYFHMTFGDVSASLLEFYRRQLPDQPSFESLDESAQESAPRLTLDHRQPIEELREQLCNWAQTQPRSAVVACIYQTVANALADQMYGLCGKEAPSLIRSAGGASHSRRWLQVKANTLGIPVLSPQTPEPTLIGTADLAARALRWNPLVQSDDADLGDRIIRPQAPLSS